MKKILTEEFFNRPAPEVAEDLLGKFLIKRFRDGNIEGFRITETEAYEGIDDLANHASKGRTERTEPMFGKPGIFYVYLVYGMHLMLNVVTREKNYPSAVLIRSIETVWGPGRLTKSLHIKRDLNNQPAISTSGLWFEDRGEKTEKHHIKRESRIGVDYAGPVWSKKLWRFVYRKPLHEK